ncbi:uncharacterized protein [Vicugna pacos]|uniref:Uncharacterized protein isoform X2 n=1 Tax=Vicugna pacos TaxID=30538 RepID=A0ABM5BDM7_VICPA
MLGGLERGILLLSRTPHVLQEDSGYDVRHRPKGCKTLRTSSGAQLFLPAFHGAFETRGDFVHVTRRTRTHLQLSCFPASGWPGTGFLSLKAAPRRGVLALPVAFSSSSHPPSPLLHTQFSFKCYRQLTLPEESYNLPPGTRRPRTGVQGGDKAMGTAPLGHRQKVIPRSWAAPEGTEGEDSIRRKEKCLGRVYKMKSGVRPTASVTCCCSTQSLTDFGSSPPTMKFDVPLCMSQTHHGRAVRKGTPLCPSLDSDSGAK